MKKYLQFLLAATVFLLLCTSCMERPVFKGVSNFKINHFSRKELSFNVNVAIYNPNNYKITIRKSTFDLFINDLYVGKAHLLEKFSMAKQRETVGNVPAQIILDPGVFLQLLNMRLGKYVELRLKGPLKASVFGFFPIRKKIDETKTINFEEMNINLNGLF